MTLDAEKLASFWLADCLPERQGAAAKRLLCRMSNAMTQINQLRDFYDHTDQSAAVAEATLDSRVGEVLVSTSIRLPNVPHECSA